MLGVGLGTEFRSEKIPRNRLGTAPVIPRKKVLIPRHSEFRGRANSEARNGMERNGIPRKKSVLGNFHSLYDHSDGLCILRKISLQNRKNNILFYSLLICSFLKSRLFRDYF
jgi:hypothetical protein